MKSLDTQAQDILDQHAKYGIPPFVELSVHEARNIPLLDYAARDLVASKMSARAAAMVYPTPEQVLSIHHQRILVKDANILLRIYTPAGPGPHPVLVYFHGGGWVIANLDVYDGSARALCNAAECIVVSVGYRQAPEHKFPIALEDCFAAMQWVQANAATFNGDPYHVAIAGESAGGNMAAVVCLMARAQGAQLPVHQLLIYPVTDFSFNTPSYTEHADASPLNAPMMKWFAGHYLKSPSEALHPYASPLQSTDLSGLPPATIITAENDPLRDDGRLYSLALQAAGVPVVYQNYEGVMHEFFGLAGLVDKADDAVRLAATELSFAFERSALEELALS